MYRWSHNTFKPQMVETVGVDYTTQHLVLHDDHVSVQVWDTAGQERFHTITKAYYKGSSAIIWIYDVTDSETYSKLSYWLTNISKHAPNSIGTIVGNKVDMGRVISEEEGRNEPVHVGFPVEPASPNLNTFPCLPEQHAYLHYFSHFLLHPRLYFHHFPHFRP